MKLLVHWQRPLKLLNGEQYNLIYTLNFEKVPTGAGVYILGRRWGGGFEALYVGKANNIRGRIKGQINNLRLMQHLRGAKTGKRVLVSGEVRTKPGQRRGRVLRLVERAFIRHFLSEGHDLVNKQGVRLRRHEVSSEGRRPRGIIPRLMYLEEAAAE